MSERRPVPNPTISIRLLWPFARIIALHPRGLELLAEARIGVQEFSDPDKRVPHDPAMHLLARAVDLCVDPGLGMKAAEQFGPSDLGVLEYAASTCATLRDAAHCATRYLRLMNDSADSRLVEKEDVAVWEFRVAEGLNQPPAANDFELSVYTSLARRYTGQDEDPIEVHFAHAAPTSEADYQRVFRCPVRLGMPFNAIVFPRAYLDAPLVHANAVVHATYAAHVNELLEGSRKQEGVTGRVRALVVENLSRGEASLLWVAKAMAMSGPTLRRRLEEEGTGHRQIVDEVRRELASRYLEDRSLPISEVAFLLGFSNVASFHKAFRRWHGTGPAEFRKQLGGGPGRAF
ncbi:MAG: AraC family transcriptional regulator [Myxococcales bacterium]